MTVAPANAVAVASARRSPIREPAPAEPQSMTTVPASATPIATHVRRRTRSPRQSHPRSPAMNGERLWMTSVLATDVRDSAMMKHVDAVAKHAAIKTPGHPVSRITSASRPRCAMTTTAARNAPQNTERQKMVVHASVATRRVMRPPVLQQIAAAVTSQKPSRRVPAVAGRSSGDDPEAPLIRSHEARV